MSSHNEDHTFSATPSQDEQKHPMSVGGFGLSSDASSDFAQPIVEDEAYYCDTAVVLVERVLFKIPRSVLSDSEVFRDMFSMPANDTPGIPPDGSSKEHPLRLEGYLADEFRILLRVIHPIPCITSELTTWQEWACALKLATVWGFADARDRAIRHLSLPAYKPPPIDQIILSKKFNVERWLVPALQELSQRTEPLSMEEGENLNAIAGWGFILRLCRVRETYSSDRKPLSTTHRDLGWNCPYCGLDNAHTVVCKHKKSIAIAPGNTTRIEDSEWPCNMCNSYKCVKNSSHVFHKPGTGARRQHDFVPAIKKEFGLDI